MSDGFDGDVPVPHVGFEGLPQPQKRVRIKNPGSRPYAGPRATTRDNSTPGSRENERYPGQYDYLCQRKQQLVANFNKPGFPSNIKAGIPNGMDKHMAAQAWDTARKLARKDMDIIKAAFPSTDEIVEEATLTLLTNIRGPVDDSIKLASAKTLLEFYKEKPKTKRDVTVSTLDTWMASLEDKSRDDD